MKKFNIHSDIRQATTLPANFYRNRVSFQQVTDQIFSRCWLFAGDQRELKETGQVKPFTLLPGVLNEPLVLSCDRTGQLHCLSNVCTHRGKIVVEKAGKQRLLSCRYHGRCFGLDGKFRSMPEFEQVANFPTEADHLHSLPLAQWMNLLYVSLNPRYSFETMTQPIRDRLYWLSFDQLRHEPRADKDYLVKANWALYIDNYLEGFHIPYVHPALNQALEFKDYDYEIFPYCNLQLGIAKPDELHFDIPDEAPDAGKRILAYYWWLFPNIMYNIYPWGISFNSIEPLDHENTMVRFRTYYFPGFDYNKEDATLHQTEMEDESVVESVQLGVQSRFYQQGRFSPTMERGVHHFHRLIADFLG